MKPETTWAWTFVNDHVWVLQALCMYQWDRAVFPPCVQFGDRVDKDDKVLILAFVKYLNSVSASTKLKKVSYRVQTRLDLGDVSARHVAFS